MNEEILQNAEFSHAAIVVGDIEKTLDEYCSLFHMERPPVKWTSPPETAEVEYQGKTTNAMAKQAFLQFGNLRVEFMEPDSCDSTWRQYLQTRGEGLHHLAFYVQGMEEILTELKAQDIHLVQRGKYNTGQYAYVESEKKLKVVLELLENNP